MEFYYADLHEDLDGEIFHPRIPINRLNTEDGTIPRVCVSSSIPGCLTAMPKYRVGYIVHVYKVESDQYLQPSTSLLPDVPFTGEFWILEPVKLKKFMTILIQSHTKHSVNGIDLDTYTYRYLSDNEWKDLEHNK